MTDDFKKWVDDAFAADPELKKRIEQDEERREQERLAEQIANERGEFWDRFFRGVGYPTRTLVFLVAIGLWVLVWYGWLKPADISDRPIGSLTLKEFGENLFWFGLWIGGLILLGGRFINYDEDIIDWEGWGKAGLWLLGAAVLGGAWWSYGA
ncbi:MAG TPA: hypothetical protein VNO69_04875 [Methyloceanibacter sp.]|nr:hypothetical protein [Methyloceanibacter sp.]